MCYPRRRVTVDAAFRSLLPALSDDELDSLAGEFEQIAFGGDIAARDAAKREVLVQVNLGLSGISNYPAMNKGFHA